MEPRAHAALLGPPTAEASTRYEAAEAWLENPGIKSTHQGCSFAPPAPTPITTISTPTSSPPGQNRGAGRTTNPGAPDPTLAYAVARAFGTVVVTVHGEVDDIGAVTLEAVLSDLIDGQGNLTVVLDAHDAQPVVVGVVAILARAAVSARGRGAQLFVHGPTYELAADLDRAGLKNLITSPRPVATPNDGTGAETTGAIPGDAPPNNPTLHRGLLQERTTP